MGKNTCFFITPEHTCFFEDREIPQPKANEVIVETKATSICGTDLHNYIIGKVGYYDFTKPFVPGHESAGVVVAVGEDVKNLSVGDRVIPEPGIPCHKCKYCLSGRYSLCENYNFMSSQYYDGTFRQYFEIPSEMCHKMPEGMSFRQGALVEPMAVAVHVVRRSGDIAGKRVTIIGAGPMGLLIGMTAKAFACGQLTFIDIVQDRLDKSFAYGADKVFNSLNGEPEENSADVVIEIAGTPGTVAQSFKIAAPGGRIVQVGWLKKDKAEIDTSLLLSKELDYVASYNYHNDFPVAIELVASGRVDAEKIVTHTFPFAKTDEAFEFTAHNPKEVLKTMVEF